MSEVTMVNLLQSIRELDRQAEFRIFQQEEAILWESEPLEPYWNCLQRTQEAFSKFKILEEEYNKLQVLLQRQETEIRKRISIEQQLKLYTDALKIQVEDLEKEKMLLLENSKQYIKELKANNQQLYADLSQAQAHWKQSREQTPARKKDKGSPPKSHSHHKAPKHDRSIREIIKTEHIERNHSSSAQAKRHRKQAYSTISGEMEVRENSKTLHVSSLQSQKKEKLNSHPSKKRNKYLFSNYTLLSYLESGKKQKHKEKTGLKSPPKKTKNTGNKSSKLKEKNRSTSPPKANSSIKQTI